MNNEFLELSARLGNDPLLTQAAGGNTSLKVDSSLWIKASGKWLANALSEEVFIPLNLNSTLAAYRAGKDDFSPFILNDSKLRPSIETAFHALIPHKVVLHIHSVNTITHAIKLNAESILEKLLIGLPWCWIPYRRPGIPLTQEIERAMNNDTQVYVLQSHGLIVGADNCEAAENLLKKVEERLHVTVRHQNSNVHKALTTKDHFIAAGLSSDGDPTINRLAIDPVSLSILNQGPIYPDQVVFLGAKPAILNNPENLGAVCEEYRKTWGKNPPYIVVPNMGVFFKDPPSPTVLEMLRCHSHVLARTDESTRLRHLSDGEIAELLNWDAEVYRQALMK